ncbi:Mu-like prophage major head subunit gpT [Cohaesibacter sp. ES.047]|uniref:Mu-like prophage major head subunit gpT family protein n=1 Tax=Cohaesibacter sp. ES.047 TaxID=1798205 RepID=UPI000BB87F8A|nr:Mu-like prophage major head subunit gpT family protein [Cohaesibacter sp. ES.047]SNY91389.1 Mu-like prophage major head subunit gpT [Cohaesibacter sp. ES.047]
MEITGVNLSDLGTGFSAAYEGGFSGVKTSYDKVADVVPSTGSENTYAWLKDWPALREWIGDRKIKQLEGESYRLGNKKFESTVAINADDINDDKYGIYTPRFKAMGIAAAQWKDRLVWPLMPLGFEAVCFDGQKFFDADHPVGSKENGNFTTVSNMQAGTGNPWFLLDTNQALKPFILQMRQEPEFNSLTDGDTSERVFMRDEYLYGVKARANGGFAFWQTAFGSKAELNAANYEAARLAMLSLENDEGDKLGVLPNLLVVGPSNEAKARALIAKERLANGEDNVWYKSIEILVSPWLK